MQTEHDSLTHYLSCYYSQLTTSSFVRPKGLYRLLTILHCTYVNNIVAWQFEHEANTLYVEYSTESENLEIWYQLVFYWHNYCSHSLTECISISMWGYIMNFLRPWITRSPIFLTKERMSLRLMLRRNRFSLRNMLTTIEALKWPVAAVLRATSKMTLRISNTPPRPYLATAESSSSYNLLPSSLSLTLRVCTCARVCNLCIVLL